MGIEDPHESCIFRQSPWNRTRFSAPFSGQVRFLYFAVLIELQTRISEGFTLINLRIFEKNFNCKSELKLFEAFTLIFGVATHFHTSKASRAVAVTSSYCSHRQKDRAVVGYSQILRSSHESSSPLSRITHRDLIRMSVAIHGAALYSPNSSVEGVKWTLSAQSSISVLPSWLEGAR